MSTVNLIVALVISVAVIAFLCKQEEKAFDKKDSSSVNEQEEN